MNYTISYQYSAMLSFEKVRYLKNDSEINIGI